MTGKVMEQSWWSHRLSIHLPLVRTSTWPSRRNMLGVERTTRRLTVARMIVQSSMPQTRARLVPRITSLVPVNRIMRTMLMVQPTAIRVVSEDSDRPGGGGFFAMVSPRDGSFCPMPNMTCQPWTMRVSSAVSGGWPTIAERGPGIFDECVRLG